MGDGVLTEPPEDERAREIWLQNAAGFVLLSSMRQEALSRLPSDLDADCQRVALDAIEGAVYGLMMLIDGVTGPVSNETYTVDVRVSARLVTKADAGVIANLDLHHGDGMCMGDAAWREGDFGGAVTD